MSGIRNTDSQLTISGLLGVGNPVDFSVSSGSGFAKNAYWANSWERL